MRPWTVRSRARRKPPVLIRENEIRNPIASLMHSCPPFFFGLMDATMNTNFSVTHIQTSFRRQLRPHSHQSRHFHIQRFVEPLH